MQKTLKKILSCQNILLLAHENPDGDALGSVTALADFLLNNKKKVQIFIPGDLPNFSFLPHFDLIKNDYNNDFDLIIACDYSDFKRTGFKDNVSDNDIITFDHHLENQGQRGLFKIINTNCSSTCELLYLFFKKLNLNISRDCALCLLTGILTDTGFFKNANVSATTFETVKDLMLKGASMQKVIKTVFKTENKILNLWSEALRLTKFDKNNNLVYTLIPYEIFSKYKDLAKEISGFASFINSTYDAKIALMLVEKVKGMCHGSLRAKPNVGINVAQIAKVFGGGGHILAAGFETNEDFDIILNKIKEILQQ